MGLSKSRSMLNEVMLVLVLWRTCINKLIKKVEENACLVCLFKIFK